MQFSVAGMSSSTTAPNLNNWGGASTGGPSFGDSLSQSRSHYQSGYLMSTSQNNNVPQGNQRVDEVPTVQTKAKMNQILSRGSTASEFGMDSMFQSSRQRGNLADEDAPPISSINDIPNEINIDPSPGRFQPRNSAFDTSRRSTLPPSSFSSHTPQRPSSNTHATHQQPLYIIVFGYPLDKYSMAVEYFQSLGATTEAEQNADIVNCFRIGFSDPGTAMRAVRKNGEVIAGSWMVGAKWADAAQAESIIGQPIPRAGFAQSTLGGLGSPTNNTFTPSPSPFGTNKDRDMNMAVDTESPSTSHANGNAGRFTHNNSHSVGTPIRLNPSAAAFRKLPPATGSSSLGTPSTPQSFGKSWNSQTTGGTPTIGMASPGTPLGGGGAAPTPPPTANKSVMGQVSDLIFGW